MNILYEQILKKICRHSKTKNYEKNNELERTYSFVATE